jgi:branched-chain amino acid aminotransferase group I
LYSFEARGKGCVAIDEPLYREWLIQKGDSVARPYSEALIKGESPDGTNDFQWKREVASLNERILDAAKSLADGGVIFLKHMAKHSFLYNLDRDPDTSLPDELNECCIVHRHVLLIRDPVAVLSSWSFSNDVHGTASPDEVGIVPMLSIYSTLVSRSSFEETSPVILLDSDELVADPERTLTGLCNDLNIPFTNSMLTWASGEHECDGPWAKWWYADVHKSEGWVVKPKSTADEGPYPASYGISKYRTLPPSLLPALRASLPAYSFLKSLTREAQTRGPLPDEIYEDPRNAHLRVWVGAPGRGRILPREMAGVNPWDSSVQGGDAAWEGLRVYRGKILSLERHLRRLFKSAKALGFQNVHTKSQVIEAIFRTLAANGMRDGAHMRLTLTRGEKCTSSMNPKFNVYGTTLIILPEWKPTEGATTYDNTRGISLITSAIRRNPPSCVDSKIHHNNMINNILPKIQANLADAADAIMLDLEGFVSETNATNIFMVDNGTLLTPHADYCLPGITRETVLILAKELGIPCEVRRVSLSEFHAADEVFTTGTMGELTPVTKIDGRIIGDGVRGQLTARLQEAYKTLPERPGWATEIPPFESAV